MLYHVESKDSQTHQSLPFKTQQFMIIDPPTVKSRFTSLRPPVRLGSGGAAYKAGSCPARNVRRWAPDPARFSAEPAPGDVRPNVRRAVGAQDLRNGVVGNHGGY